MALTVYPTKCATTWDEHDRVALVEYTGLHHSSTKYVPADSLPLPPHAVLKPNLGEMMFYCKDEGSAKAVAQEISRAITAVSHRTHEPSGEAAKPCATCEVREGNEGYIVSVAQTAGQEDTFNNRLLSHEIWQMLLPPNATEVMHDTSSFLTGSPRIYRNGSAAQLS